MRILNTTRSTLLAGEANMAATFWRRLVGLLGKAALAPGQGLVIEPCRSIHTMFMRFSIDAVFVDQKLIVIQIVSHLKPFRASVAGSHSRAVVELPAGTVERTNTRVGDTLSFPED